jgi:hypothetical protein
MDRREVLLEMVSIATIATLTVFSLGLSAINLIGP